MKDAETFDNIIAELRNISDQLKRYDNANDSTLVNFYRDSLEFMVEENLKSYQMLKSLLRQGHEVHSV